MVFVFWIVMWIGASLLMTPWATANGQPTPMVDALFTSASALFVTGLSVFDTGSYWSLFGQLVILGLIQVGALGVVVLGGYLTMLMGRRVYYRDRKMLGDSLGSAEAGGALRLLKQIMGYVLVIELVGSLLLSGLFWQYEQSWRAFYWGVFHAVSAFGNAGFDVLGMNSSLAHFAGDGWVVLVVGLLIMIGGLGFPVWTNVLSKLRGNRLSYHAKIVLLANACCG